MTGQVRILVADDHPIVRDGLTAVLSTQPDFQVVGEAGSGNEVARLVEEMRPDVVLLDLQMPDGDGVEALTQMRESHPDVRVIVFTAFDTDERILAAVQAGAKGYLLKGTPREQIFDAIRVVHSGGSLLQPIIASKLLQQISHSSDSPAATRPVTPREHEVLTLMTRGMQNKEIAADLGISVRTVKFHVTSILGKMNANNRTEAVSVAVQRGLIQI